MTKLRNPKNQPNQPSSGLFKFNNSILIALFSIASLLGMGSSNESLTPNLVFNPTTAAATLSQMRLFQVENLFCLFYSKNIFRPDWLIRYGIHHLHHSTTTTITCYSYSNELLLELNHQHFNRNGANYFYFFVQLQSRLHHVPDDKLSLIIDQPQSAAIVAIISTTAATTKPVRQFTADLKSQYVISNQK